jgi:hypothetical protein
MSFSVSSVSSVGETVSYRSRSAVMEMAAAASAGPAGDPFPRLPRRAMLSVRLNLGH